MRRVLFLLFLIGLAPLWAAGTLEVRAPGYGWQNAEYSTSHVFIDEVAGTSAPIEVGFDPGVFIDEGAGGRVEVFTNLNRRDLAGKDRNGDGEHDGILPVDGTTIADIPAHTDPVTGHYFIPHPMSFDGGAGRWLVTIPATKTGAYRLTARFRAAGSDPWTWYGLRDHAVVVSPVQARDIRMYELNVLNIEADGTGEGDRSTWEDLSDRPGALHTAPGRANQWNLDYVRGLGVNWLWFQPYHPYGMDGRHLSAADINARDPGANASTWLWNGGAPYEDVNFPYALGSPYAVKNFWEVEPRTTGTYNPSDPPAVQRDKAMDAFLDFMDDADAAGIQVMPDAAFNHAAWDVEVGPVGVDLFSGGAPWAETDAFRDRELRFFSRENDYYQRAGLGPGEGIAPGPDRYDFGKWLDVKDIFFGRYAALWRDAGSTGKQKDEGDWFDTTPYGFNGFDGGSFDAVTRNTWKYFAEYVPYWIAQGRPAGEARNSEPGDGDTAARHAWDARGIDGLRCDFGQGLPPQCWEYIINRARSVKWSFVFMAESLDGGEVTYRSSRHFDLLNENIVFAVKGTGNASGLAGIYEQRRTAYGQGLVLLNTVSHDEANYADPWVALSRYAVHGTMDGAPMIFAGQELGLSDFFGYDLMERNLGKFIPHFKTWNSMMPLWVDTDFGNDQLYNVYAAVNEARSKSPALRSGERWFLSGNEALHAVVKYEEEGVPARLQDVVLAFVNLDRNSDQGGSYVIPGLLASRIGLEDGRQYQVMNIAAYERPPAVTGRREQLLWPSPKTGAELKSAGFSVLLRDVPGSIAEWDSEPYEAQYLRLVDVTEPLVVEVSSLEVVDGEVVVQCASVPGRYYHLERSATLAPGSWTTVAANVKAATTTLALSDPEPGAPTMFYRLGVSYGPL